MEMSSFDTLLDSTKYLELSDLEMADPEEIFDRLCRGSDIFLNSTTSISLDLKERVCSVCDKKMGHNRLFYGQRVCSSCRAFFRRSLINNNYQSFLCHSPTNRSYMCSIDSQSWKSCRFCRFRICLKIGLGDRISPKKLEEIEKFMTGVIEKHAKCRNPLKYSINMGFTLEEASFIDFLVQEVQSFIYERMIRCYSLNISAFADLIDASANKSPIRAETIFSLSATHQLAKKFAWWTRIQLEDFQTLPVGDQRKLIEFNMPNFSCLYHSAVTFNDSMTCDDHFLKFCHTIQYLDRLVEKEKRADLYHLLEFLDNNLIRNKTLHPFSYFQLYKSPWAPSIDIEREHKEIFEKLREWPQRDPKKIILMCLILMYTTQKNKFLPSGSSTQYQCRDRIKALEDKYTMLLYRYVQSLNEDVDLLRRDVNYIQNLAQRSTALNMQRLPV